jgi:PAS domain S-box-containing protein
MITQFLLNVAIIGSISVIAALVLEQYAKMRLRHDLLQGLLFGLTAIFTMMHPVQFEEGLISDARTVVLSLCAWFFGTVPALISTILAVTYRWSLSGSGAVTGILAATAASAVGLILHYQRPISENPPNALDLLLFGLCVHLIVVGLIGLTLPKFFLIQVTPFFLILYPLTTMLCGKILVNQFRLRETLNTLNIQNQHIQLITDTLRDVIWVLEYPSLKFSYISPSNVLHNGYTPGEAIRMTLEETLSPSSYKDVQTWLKEDLASALNPESSDATKTRLIQERCKDGSFIWSEISVSIVAGTDGLPSRIIGVSRNVSKRIDQETALQENEHRYRVLSEDLQKSLSEKDALLKEVHHRVKNNLQIITSLLRLEATRLPDPEIREVILDMQRRVRSMSLLHETVYQSDSLAGINMVMYFHNLTRQVLNTMSARHTRIQPELEIAPVDLDIEQAIPCGLLLNELLSNACKHAFDPDRPGQIRVCLSKKDTGHFVLDVTDNGKGLPSDFQQRRKSSLGLQLVEDLTRQLNGTLDIQSDGGTAFRITFPASPAGC